MDGGGFEMGFWIFMVISSMTLPVLMIIIGYVFVKHPPRTINGIYGYRTSMSRKNQKTWDFAHYYCGKLWWKTGWVMCFLTLPIALPVIGKSDDAVGGILGIWVCLQCGVMIVTIAIVERKLKKNFDKNGNAR